MIKTFNPSELNTKMVHAYLLGAIGPRPIALASTINSDGKVNLSPFSFFNVFSSNPPILIFSPSRRVRDNTTKHTLHNVKETKEVVINIVDYAIVQQTSLSSTEYGAEINEFTKSGLTEESSIAVKPPRVKESPVQYECKVNDIIELGADGGAGNLVICEVLRIHINARVLDENGMIDQTKIDLVGRMGGDYYSRAHGESLFQVEKPQIKLGIGVDEIPKRIRQSVFLDGNDLGKLGNVEKLPSDEEVNEISQHHRVKEILENSADGMEVHEGLHQYAKELLDNNKVSKAWKVLLCDKLNRN